MPRVLRLEPLDRRQLMAADIAQIVAFAPSGEDVETPPSFVSTGDLSLVSGSPLHVPIDATSTDGGPLTVSVSVADTSLVEAVVLTGNRSVRLKVAEFGDLVFELFEDRAPRASERIATLVENGFYDGITFHRVDDGFVLQAGDPSATGRGGSDLGDFDDEFHPDLQHAGPGVMSFAKAGDDTNDSQFFITEVPTHFLDFNHSVFGQLTEGESIREAISSVEVDDDDKPTTNVVIEKATLFNDNENSVVMLKALANSGSTDVTFTVTDSKGRSSSETITVDLQADRFNAQPYLLPITESLNIPAGKEFSMQLESFDLENDAVTYLASTNSGDIAGSLNPQTGVLTITPNADYVGPVEVLVGVRASVNAGESFDSQRLAFTVYNSYHDPIDRFDVNRDSKITASDALAIINAINEYGGNIPVTDAALDLSSYLRSDYRYNANGDEQISAFDALQIINTLSGESDEDSEPEQVRKPSSGDWMEGQHRSEKSDWKRFHDEAILRLF